MEKRPRRFSLPEAFFEGSRFLFLTEAKGMDEEAQLRYYLWGKARACW